MESATESRERLSFTQLLYAACLLFPSLAVDAKSINDSTLAAEQRCLVAAATLKSGKSFNFPLNLCAHNSQPWKGSGAETLRNRLIFFFDFKI